MEKSLNKGLGRFAKKRQRLDAPLFFSVCSGQGGVLERNWRRSFLCRHHFVLILHKHWRLDPIGFLLATLGRRGTLWFEHGHFTTYFDRTMARNKRKRQKSNNADQRAIKWTILCNSNCQVVYSGDGKRIWPLNTNCSSTRDLLTFRGCLDGQIWRAVWSRRPRIVDPFILNDCRRPLNRWWRRSNVFSFWNGTNHQKWRNKKSIDCYDKHNYTIHLKRVLPWNST